MYEMEDLKQIRHAHRLILFHRLMNPGSPQGSLRNSPLVL